MSLRTLDVTRTVLFGLLPPHSRESPADDEGEEQQRKSECRVRRDLENRHLDAVDILEYLIILEEVSTEE